MSFQEVAKDKWNLAKPVLKGLIIGLIIGPIFVLWNGWVVTSSTMDAKVHAALVEEEASICAARARAEVKFPSKLNYDKRSKLAEKYSVMPGENEDSADYEVRSKCSDKLENAS